MSLYNMINGLNGNLVIVASVILGWRVDSLPRFRDVFTDAEDSPYKNADLYIYTRMGGGNRDCWESDKENCDCPAHKADKLEKENWCLGSWDDDFDCTYRTFAIQFTPEQKAEFEALKAGQVPKDFEARALELFPKKAEEPKP